MPERSRKKYRAFKKKKQLQDTPVMYHGHIKHATHGATFLRRFSMQSLVTAAKTAAPRAC